MVGRNNICHHSGFVHREHTRGRWLFPVLYRDVHRPDDGGSKYLCNVGKLIPVYTMLQPRRRPSSYSPPSEPQILLSMTKLHSPGACMTVSTFFFHHRSTTCRKKRNYVFCLKGSACRDTPNVAKWPAVLFHIRHVPGSSPDSDICALCDFSWFY
jgi:hypothetical protein